MEDVVLEAIVLDEIVGMFGVAVVVESVVVFRGTTSDSTTNDNSNNFINLAQCPVLLHLLLHTQLETFNLMSLLIGLSLSLKK